MSKAGARSVSSPPNDTICKTRDELRRLVLRIGMYVQQPIQTEHPSVVVMVCNIFHR